MKKIIASIFVILFFSSISLWSQTLQNEMSKAIDKMERQQSSKDCARCDLVTREEVLAQAELMSCLISLCPEREPPPTADFQQRQKLNQWFSTTIKVYEDNYNRKKREAERSRDSAINEWLGNPGKLNKTETAIFNLGRYLSYWLLQNLSHLRDGSATDDLNIIRSNFPDFTKETEKEYLEFVRLNADSINSLKNDLVRIQKEDFGLDQEGHKFITDSVASALEDIDKDVTRTLGQKDLSNLAMLRNMDQSTIELLKFRAKTGSLSSSDIKTISYAKRTSAFLREIFSKPGAVDSLSKQNFKPELYSNKPDGGMEAMPVVFGLMKKLKSAGKDSYCDKMLNDLMDEYPSEQQISAAKKDFMTLKSQALRAIKGRISAESFDNLERLSSSWSPTFSVSREVKMEQIERQFEQEKQLFESNTDILEKSKQSGSNLPFALALASKQSGIKSIRALLNGPTYLQTSCARFSASKLDDSVQHNVIQISSSTVKNDQQKGAVLHELGHLILNQLGNFYEDKGGFSFHGKSGTSEGTKAWMNKVASCLQDNYQTYFKSRPDLQNLKEDFADTVAFNSEDPKKNFLCSAIRTRVKERGDSLLDLSLPSSKSTSKYENEFYRLLLSQALRPSGLSQSCSGILREAGISPQFKNCFNLNQ